MTKEKILEYFFNAIFWQDLFITSYSNTLFFFLIGDVTMEEVSERYNVFGFEDGGKSPKPKMQQSLEAKKYKEMHSPLVSRRSTTCNFSPWLQFSEIHDRLLTAEVEN